MASILHLAPEGIFPLPSPETGLTDLGLPTAGTLQGEGILAGVPSIFIRLAGCNMRCLWPNGGAPIPCDTPQAQTHEKSRTLAVEAIADTLSHHRGAINHLVVSGGEPLLQATPLLELFRLLKDTDQSSPFHITVETNGSIFHTELAHYIDLISISPKLSEVQGKTCVPEPEYIRSIQQWLNSKPEDNALQLKFVVGRAEDEAGITSQFLAHLEGYQHHPILLMPLGASPEQLAASTPVCLELALRRNWRYSPRLHVDLWGNRPGL